MRLDSTRRSANATPTTTNSALFRVVRPLSDKGLPSSSPKPTPSGCDALAHIGRRQVHQQAYAAGEFEGGVAHGGAHALSGLLDGGVGEADNGDFGIAGGGIDLDLHGEGIDTKYGGSINLSKHNIVFLFFKGISCFIFLGETQMAQMRTERRR